MKKTKLPVFLLMFKFADALDKFLLILGTVSAILIGALYPLFYYHFAQLIQIFIGLNALKSPGTRINVNISMSWESSLRHVVLILVFESFATMLACYLAHACWNLASKRQLKRIRLELFKSIMRREVEFFEHNSPGQLNFILIGNLEKMKQGMGLRAVDFMVCLSRAFGCIIFSTVLTWKFSILAWSFFLPLLILMFAMQRWLKKYSSQELNSYSHAARIAQEVLSCLRTVLAYGMEKKWIDEYSKRLDDAELMNKKKRVIHALYASLNSACFNFLHAFLVYYSVVLFIDDSLTYNPGILNSSFFCLILSGTYLNRAAGYSKDFSSAMKAAADVFEIIHGEERLNSFDKKIIPNLSGCIEFEEVCFSYPKRPDYQVLNGFNIRAEAGKTIALVGHSGSGKSSVLSLLERLYLPSSGRIKIDGVPVEDLDLAWLRNQIGLVPQEPVLFSASIKDNIRLGNLEAGDEEIEEAAKKANAHEFITRLESGYDTLVGERGAQLSGGQKQRIAIARALVRSPRILLLDEATSALDYDTERVVKEALDGAKIGRTTLIVAQRLSTIRDADLIVYMEDGQAKEVGTHDDLMDAKGLYFRLVQSQVVGDLDASSFDRFNNRIGIENVETEKTHKPSSKKESIHRRGKLFEIQSKIMKYHQPEYIFLVLGTLAKIINACLPLVIRFITFQVFKIFSIADNKIKLELAIRNASLIIGLMMVNMMAQSFSIYVFDMCGSRLTTRLRRKMFESMLRQEVAFHDREENKSSILSSRLTNAPNLCRSLTSDQINLFSHKLTLIAVTLSFGFVYSWKLTLLMIGFVLIAILNSTLSVSIVSRAETRARVSAQDQLSQLAVEVFDNYKTILCFNLNQYFVDEYERIQNSTIKINLLLINIQAFFYSVANSLVFLIQCGSYSFASDAIKSDELDFADFSSIVSVISFASFNLGELLIKLPDYKKCTSSAQTVFQIIDRTSKIDPFSDKGFIPRSLVGHLRFQNVSFSYPTRPDEIILNKFDLDLAAGQTNALVGPSGSGKSTIVALLFRFYDVDEGAIYLDDVDIRDLNVKWLRSQIGLVAQEPVLFDISIHDNIVYGDLSRSKIEEVEVVESAIQANIHKRIESLPRRYETVVGSKGAELCGGEKQTIAIARALIRKPKILVLDEATSALDASSERLVQDALDKALLGRTSVLIAHRLSTIQNANRIAVLRDGHLVETGSQCDLLERKGVYFNLYNSMTI